MAASVAGPVTAAAPVVAAAAVAAGGAGAGAAGRSRTSSRHWADRLPTVGVALASFYSLFTGDWGFRQVPEITSELHGCV